MTERSKTAVRLETARVGDKYRSIAPEVLPQFASASIERTSTAEMKTCALVFPFRFARRRDREVAVALRRRRDLTSGTARGSSDSYFHRAENRDAPCRTGRWSTRKRRKNSIVPPPQSLPNARLSPSLPGGGREIRTTLPSVGSAREQRSLDGRQALRFAGISRFAASLQGSRMTALPGALPLSIRAQIRPRTEQASFPHILARRHFCCRPTARNSSGSAVFLPIPPPR